MFPLNNQDRKTAPLINTDRKSKETNIHTNISAITQSKTNSSSSISNSSFRDVNDNSNISLKINDIRLKQIQLEEKLNHIVKDAITHDLTDDHKNQIETFQPFLTSITKAEEFPEGKLKFIRTFLWNFCSDLYNWKSLAHSIYHIEHLIHNLDNYQIREFIQKQFKILLNDFILFIKDLITIQMKLQKQEFKENESPDINETFVSSIPQTTFPEINSHNQIEQHIQNLKMHIISLKELILTTKERFHICQTDTNALQTLLQSIDDISFDSKTFDKQDQDNIRLLTLKQDLSQKSNKTDLIQFKNYIDNQIKKLIELNKQNAKELERIKLIKSATCEARQMQTILSINPSPPPPPPPKKQNRMYSYQSSQPYITLELDHIRKYQRQALLKSPYGAIPLYRRQAWAAANLFHDHPLHLLRYMQNSLRMQIHHLLGYDPSDICNTNKKTKIIKNSNIEIFNTTNDISIMGNNNKLYRGRIDSCEILPLKSSKEKKSKIKINIDENNENIKINFDQFDQINKTTADEYLFEYLDWQTQFNEQDLPDELCEELFHHWKSILCEDQPCICNLESKSEENDLISIQIDSSSASSLNPIDDDQCICSLCSCDCEKYPQDESICLCSQCSCKCLKDFPNENQHILEDFDQKILSNNPSNHLINELNINQEFQAIPTDQISIVEQVEENEKAEIIVSDCFINRIDRWTRQFDLFQDTWQSPSLPEQNDIAQFQTSTSVDCAPNNISHPLELDDPTLFRQQILNHHEQHK